MPNSIKKIALLLFCLVTLTNCSEKILLPNSYYDNSNKVGVLYIIDSIKTTTKDQVGNAVKDGLKGLFGKKKN